jgi:hypothetical protein
VRSTGEWAECCTFAKPSKSWEDKLEGNLSAVRRPQLALQKSQIHQ